MSVKPSFVQMPGGKFLELRVEKLVPGDCLPDLRVELPEHRVPLQEVKVNLPAPAEIVLMPGDPISGLRVRLLVLTETALVPSVIYTMPAEMSSVLSEKFSVPSERAFALTEKGSEARVELLVPRVEILELRDELPVLRVKLPKTGDEEPPPPGSLTGNSVYLPINNTLHSGYGKTNSCFVFFDFYAVSSCSWSGKCVNQP